jgi:hypothetical protein
LLAWDGSNFTASCSCWDPFEHSLQRLHTNPPNATHLPVLVSSRLADACFLSPLALFLSTTPRTLSRPPSPPSPAVPPARPSSSEAMADSSLARPSRPSSVSPPETVSPSSSSDTTPSSPPRPSLTSSGRTRPTEVSSSPPLTIPEVPTTTSASSTTPLTGEISLHLLLVWSVEGERKGEKALRERTADVRSFLLDVFVEDPLLRTSPRPSTRSPRPSRSTSLSLSPRYVSPSASRPFSSELADFDSSSFVNFLRSTSRRSVPPRSDPSRSRSSTPSPTTSPSSATSSTSTSSRSTSTPLPPPARRLPPSSSTA